MAINFPTSLDTLTNPTSTDLLENAVPALDHHVQHANANDAIEALEAKVGIDGSAVTTSHDYKLSEVTSTDKAVGKTATQTLTNKTLTSPQVNMGSDANGDLLYRNGSGATARLPIGATDQILAVQSGLPAWVANPSATPATTSVAGIVELAIASEVTTGTDATRAVTPDALADTADLSNMSWVLDEDTMSSDDPTKVPTQQSVKAYVDTSRSFTNGTTSKNVADADATQTIAHGLGKTPKKVVITAVAFGVGPSGEDVMRQSKTVYNGTTQSSVSFYNDSSNTYSGTVSANFRLNVGNNLGSYNTGVVTFDATNISIAWTKTSAPTGTYTILWEAEA